MAKKKAPVKKAQEVVWDSDAAGKPLMPLSKAPDYGPEKSIDERVAEVFSGPEPIEMTLPASELNIQMEGVLVRAGNALDADADAWLVEARACREVFAAGNAVSPDEVKRLLVAGVSLVERYRA